jgi:hypothetical protein
MHSAVRLHPLPARPPTLSTTPQPPSYRLLMDAQAPRRAGDSFSVSKREEFIMHLAPGAGWHDVLGLHLIQVRDLAVFPRLQLAGLLADEVQSLEPDVPPS